MRDRRKEARVSIRKRATIHCRASKKPLKCTIMDLSSLGARLSLDGESRLSDRIVLLLPGDNLRLEAMVRWFDGTYCGVQFKEQIAHPYLTQHRIQNGAVEHA